MSAGYRQYVLVVGQLFDRFRDKAVFSGSEFLAEEPSSGVTR